MVAVMLQNAFQYILAPPSRNTLKRITFHNLTIIGIPQEAVVSIPFLEFLATTFVSILLSSWWSRLYLEGRAAGNGYICVG